MGRPSKSEKRDHQLNVKLTVAEFQWVAREATTAGLRPGEFGRAKVLADRTVTVPARAEGPQLDPLLLASLARIGNNLNQLTRLAHGGTLLPRDLYRAIEALREEVYQVREEILSLSEGRL